MFRNLELYAVAGVGAGALIVLIGVVWLIRRGFHTHWAWGLATLVPPLALLFWLCRPRRATGPWLVILLGAAIVGGTMAAGRYITQTVELGPFETTGENGQVQLTLTGWDRGPEDYAALKERTDVAVLQMANKDVTDAVVGYLAGHDNLIELDLTDTAITDASLEALAKLPKLRVLRVARTAVTDEGFRQHLMGKGSLMELDARGTRLASKTLRDWKNAEKDRKYLK